jgi:hypothetical protein
MASTPPSLSPWPSPSRSNSLRSHASDELQYQSQTGQGQQCLPVIEFGMHAFTVGSAVLSVMRWVGELRERLPRPPSTMEPMPAPIPLHSVVLILNKGKPSREHTYPAIRAALLAMLKAWKSPFVLTDISQGCRIEAPAMEASAWVHGNQADAALARFVDTNHESINPVGLGKESFNSLNAFNAFAQEDAVVEGRCSEAYAAVRQFEAAYERNVASRGKGLLCNGTPISQDAEESQHPDDLGTLKAKERKKWFDGTAELAKAVGLSEEVMHDAFLLSERAIAAAREPLGTNRLALAVACLATAARQAGEEKLVAAQFASVAGVAGLAPGEWETAFATVSSLLNEETASISALRVLKLYLERLGADFSTVLNTKNSASCFDRGATLWPASGEAFALLPLALCDDLIRHEPPSLVAAAVLVAGRQLAGLSPSWPTTLQRLTGMTADESLPLGKAVTRMMKLVAEDEGIEV